MSERACAFKLNCDKLDAIRDINRKQFHEIGRLEKENATLKRQLSGADGLNDQQYDGLLWYQEKLESIEKELPNLSGLRKARGDANYIIKVLDMIIEVVQSLATTVRNPDE